MTKMSKRNKRALTLAVAEILSGGIVEAQAAQTPDTEVPTNPIAITDTYDGYNKQTSQIKEINEDTIWTFEESMKTRGYALIADLSGNNMQNENNSIVDFLKELNREIHPSLIMVRSHSVVESNFQEDTILEEYVKGCAEIGMPVGVYFIARLTQNEEEVRRETNILIQRLNELETKYNIKIEEVAIDYEEPAHTAYPEICVKNIQIIKEMLEEQNSELEGHKRNLSIYTTSICRNELDNAAKKEGIDNFEGIESWIASYSNKNSYDVSSRTQSLEEAIKNANTPSYENPTVTQFADNVKVLDDSRIDVSFINDENFIQTKETEEKSSNHNNNKTDPVKMETISHIVKSGETVSEICELYGMTIEEFKYYNPQINDINLIQEKQLVEVPKELVDKIINQSESQSKEDNITQKSGIQQIGNIKGAIYLIGGSALTSYVINGIVERKKRVAKAKNSFEHSDNYNRMNYYDEETKRRR